MKMRADEEVMQRDANNDIGCKKGSPRQGLEPWTLRLKA